MLLKVSCSLVVIQKLTSIKHDFLAETENKSRVLLQLDSSTEIQKVRAVSSVHCVTSDPHALFSTFMDRSFHEVLNTLIFIITLKYSPKDLQK